MEHDEQQAAEPPESPEQSDEVRAPDPVEGREPEQGDRASDVKRRLLLAAKVARELLPGDPALGDPLSTAGDQPASVLARRLSEAGADRPSVLREVGLGALQVWQSMSDERHGGTDCDVTILFTDLVGFSDWALRAGDEAAIDLLRRVGRATEPAVTERRGEIVKRLGDGLMAAFDGPQGAIEAALEACGNVAALEATGYRPKLRAGLHAGRARKLGGDYFGVDVNIAARVAQAAGGHQVLISDATRGQIDPDTFKVRRMWRFRRSKGAPRDLALYAVSAR